MKCYINLEYICDDEKNVVVTNDVKWIPNVLYTIKSSMLKLKDIL